MAEGDNRRVELRTGLVGRGMGVTPESIAELEQRQRQVDKLSKKEPVRSFGDVLGKPKAAPVAKPSRKDEKRSKLPAKGPRPKLVHPGQREAFGREGDDDDTVILKG